MEREFVIFKSFEKTWEACGFTDEDLRKLQNILCQDPTKGSVIPGTGGIRKLRLGIKGRGKRGGIRTIYIDFAMYEQIYLLAAYPKNVQEDLTDEQKSILKAKIADIEVALKRGNKKI